MTKEELIDKILSDLYLNSNRAMNFFEDFCVYENDVNRLDEVKHIMEKEGLIKDYKNRKTGITPLGFKVCFEGGYLEEKIKKERQIRQVLHKNKSEIAYLRKKIRSTNRWNTFLAIVTLTSFLLILLMAFGIVDLSF
jgi:hypothetical protein